MSHYLLIIMGVLAVSACTDNRTHGRTSNSSGSTPANEMEYNRQSDGYLREDRDSFRGKTDKAAANRPSRTSQMDEPGMNAAGSNRAQSTNRPGSPPLVADNWDRKGSKPTAGDQSENDADRKITQQIRQAVVADSALSVKAQNSTIITINGIVTLRGTVDSAAESLSIGRKAEAVSGVRRVENNLEIVR